MKTGFWVVLALMIGLMNPLLSYAVAPMSAESVNEAVRYGMMNQSTGLGALLGYNWQEGPNGVLLNVYTPFMEIAKKVYKKKNLPSNPTAQEVQEAKKKVVKDIDYIWQHPTVKFIVSMYGPSATFAKDYYAVIEGVGKGRTIRILPSQSIPDYSAKKDDPNAKESPTAYTAINTYHFKFADIERLDSFTLKLYGKNVEPIQFRLNNKRLL